MTSDYKWDVQVLAEELAMEYFESDFYDLPQELQLKVYQAAMSEHWNKLADQADYLRKREREEGA